MREVVDNRYVILRALGSGGMGKVYLAHDEILDRDVAVKVLDPHHAEHPEFVERFKREARSAASLSHPNIVTVHDWGKTEDGTYYIAMEYVPGGTLEDRISGEQPLPPSVAVGVALQVAKALEAAHLKGIIHRDIKPQNLLVTEAGEVKVTDFGIAHAASLTTLTQTGFVMGTAHYISPEQAMGEPVGPQSDLYSLGVVLYEMLTGEVPYDAHTPMGIAMKHVNGRLRPPKEVNQAIPDRVNALTVDLLAKDPEERPADAATLIDTLERVKGGLPEDTTQVLNQATPYGRSGPGGQTGRTEPYVTPASPTSHHGDDRGGGRRRHGGFPWSMGAVLAAGLAIVLLIGVGSLAAIALGLGIGLPGGAEPQQENTPKEESATEQDDVANQGEGTGENVSNRPEDLEADLRRVVEDYYEAVDREDWAYTYEHLASQTRQAFTQEEWTRKNQWFADNYPQELRSMDIAAEVSPSALVADVTVDRNFKDGSSLSRDTQFIYEDGSWKHLFSQEEIDLFMPDATFEEFVEAQRGGSSGGSSNTTGSRLEEAAVEGAIRGHYGAIGGRNFERAYSYFGPTFRGTTDQQRWIADEKTYGIRGSTINSLEVTSVSGSTATADVDVSFRDNTGSPRFKIAWKLVKEDGRWKLDEQLSAQKTTT